VRLKNDRSEIETIVNAFDRSRARFERGGNGASSIGRMLSSENNAAAAVRKFAFIFASASGGRPVTIGVALDEPDA